jgi:hypothetical protein
LYNPKLIVDELSAAMFGSAPVIVLDQSCNEGNLESGIANLFGEGVVISDIVHACAVPSDAQVEVSVGPNVLQIAASKGNFIRRMVRTFRRNLGVVDVEHVSLAVVNPAAGVGTRILARAVAGYESIGVQEIELYADGRPRTSRMGFYVWPRLGFKMDFFGELLFRVERAGFEALNSHDLFLDYPDEGSAWWKEEGEPGECRFSVTEHSNHRMLLDLYLKERGIHV